MELRYRILDPTGNITALAESPVGAAERQAAAAAIMQRHDDVEQVGFLNPEGEDGLPALQMAGGEFCGNATMCAAALLSLRCGGGDTVRLRVSGAGQPMEVKLCRTGDDSFRAELQMPPAIDITERAFAFEGLRGRLPLVRMEGISHMVVESPSPFFALLDDPETAERAVKAFCAELSADGLGLLFLEGEGQERRMTPLVYIPGSGTVFWENSCASGSAAVGMYLAAGNASPTEVSLREPGGVLHVASDPTGTRLRGNVRLAASHIIEF